MHLLKKMNISLQTKVILNSYLFFCKWTCAMGSARGL